MGGEAGLKRLQSAAMVVEAKKGQVKERHTLRLRGRYMHYASRRPSGAGFDVVLARGQSFLCDRDAKGVVTYVEDLRDVDAKEGSYERDILFMPLLLPLLLKKRARMQFVSKNSVGDSVVRAMIRPPEESDGEPFTIRLRFDKDTDLLVAAMGTVPWGADKGKKRYCFYDDYRSVGRGLKLPHALKDQRGKDARPRSFSVRWELDADLAPAMWLRCGVRRRGRPLSQRRSSSRPRSSRGRATRAGPPSSGSGRRSPTTRRWRWSGSTSAPARVRRRRAGGMSAAE
jgi:hypothetical protein